MVCRLHQRIMDAAGRPDRAIGGKAVGAHGCPRLHPRLSASRRCAHAWNINAGYVQRALHALPKSGTHRPWNVRHNYVLDAIDHRFDRIEESMVFGRVDTKSAQSA